jgi:hypothetical protein
VAAIVGDGFDKATDRHEERLAALFWMIDRTLIGTIDHLNEVYRLIPRLGIETKLAQPRERRSP